MAAGDEFACFSFSFGCSSGGSEGFRYSIRRSHHGFKVRSGVMATGRVDMVGLSFRYERSEVRNGVYGSAFSARSVCVRSDDRSTSL